MGRKKLTQRELAEALGISQPAVCKLRRAGMPGNTVENAMAWRAGNLDPVLVEARRRERHGPPPAAPVPVAARPADLDALLDQALVAARSRILGGILADMAVLGEPVDHDRARLLLELVCVGLAGHLEESGAVAESRLWDLANIPDDEWPEVDRIAAHLRAEYADA